MSNRPINSERQWFVLLPLTILLFAICIVGAARVKAQAADQCKNQNLSDEQVSEALASLDASQANQAVREIMRRGERMIPLLMKLRGDKRFFYGHGFFGRDSAWSGPSMPEAGDDPNEGRFATVEVAAMYMISSIYHGTTEFADSIYLSDNTPVKNDRFNTPERVAAAWTSVEQWIVAFEQQGLKKLQHDKIDPLSYSKLHFW
jgi:hypothetical protein